jgi:hypothetical protein
MGEKTTRENRKSLIFNRSPLAANWISCYAKLDSIGLERCITISFETSSARRISGRPGHRFYGFSEAAAGILWTDRALHDFY